MIVTYEDLIPGHPYPYFHLGEEAWIPVETTTGTTRFGFADLLRRSHEVIVLSIGDPLEKFALLRYLMSLTYLIYAYDPEGDWEGVVKNSQPLPSPGVEAVIERMKDKWWLYHPKTPFAQIPELRALMSKKFTEKDTLETATENFECLVPFRPSKNNESWWYKPDGTRGLTHFEAPLVLLSRHYAAVMGNEAGILNEPKSRCEGGLMLAGPQEITNVFIGTPTLSHTLAVNMMASIANEISTDSTLFFEDPLHIADHLDDYLYLYSASGGASFLVWPGENAVATRVLRAPLPVEAAKAKDLMIHSKLRDPHVLRVKPKIGSSGTDNPNKGLVAFSSVAAQFENVFEFYKRTEDGSSRLRSCVLQPRSLFIKNSIPNSLIGVTIAGGGTFTGARIEAVNQIALDPIPFLLGPEQAKALRTLVAKLADSKNSCLAQLKYELKHAIFGLSKPSSAKEESISRDAQILLWQSLDASVATIYRDIASSPEGPWLEELPEETKREWIEHTCLVFDKVTSSYVNAPKMRSRVVKCRHNLRSSLWKKI